MNETQMLNDAQNALAGLGIDLSALFANGFSPFEPFTDDLLAPIAQRYGFLPDSILTVQIVLNVAVAISSFEAKWTSSDLPKVRKKFEAVKKHSRALHDALQDLDEEDFYAANEAAGGQAYASNAETMRLCDMDPMEPTASLAWDGSRATLQRPEEKPLDLDELTKMLNAVNQAMDLSLRYAGKGKTGRPKDGTLEALLVSAFQIYEHFSGKAFTLQWHDDNSPISEAACFCTDIVRVFDDKIPLAKLCRPQTPSAKILLK